MWVLAPAAVVAVLGDQTAYFIGRRVRTFVPVLAGVCYMRYPLFLGFDVIGGIAWGAGLTLLGYFLGSRVPFVHDHLEVVLLLIALLSVLPGILSMGRALPQRVRRPKTRPSEQVSWHHLSAKVFRGQLGSQVF